MNREFKISERQLNDILESISRIDRQVEMIKKGNTEVKGTGVKRLDIILEKTLLVNITIKDLKRLWNFSELAYKKH